MDELTKQVQEKTLKTIDSLKSNYCTLRSGRANPNMLNNVYCEYYGEKMLINQLSSITSPEPRQILIKPYDSNDVKTILTGISQANLGLNPTVDGAQIRIIIPPLTEDTRREIVKKAKTMTEEAKVAIRNVRREFLDFLKEDDSYSDDLKKRIEEEIQKVIDESIKNIDSLFANKEKEILTI